MCGICGQFNPEGVQPELILGMMGALRHRGPDDEGLYVRGSIGIGSRRLSIIDLPGGNQPISNEDGTVWIVLNGEIYNYRQLRAELEARGHRFRTNSDTEVIVHLYEEAGEQCVDQLSGMFAFAIWDENEKKLLLARDRIGQKPLYYAQAGASFLFGSEQKAILAATGQPAVMDLEALHEYLSLRFISPPRTIFKGISKLPAAHILVLEDGQIRTRQYWSLSYRDKLSLSESELIDSLQDRLKGAVNSHLVSDVPVGSFLSGGLDSSMIVAILAGELNQKTQTFSIGVEESDFDERPYARIVAERFGTTHVEQQVAANLIRSLPTMVWHMDEPSDPIAACMFQAARLASQHVKVVLGGDGGDELFAGFDRYVGSRYIDAYRLLPEAVRRKLVSPVLGRLPDSFTYKSMTQKLRWVHQLSLNTSPAEQYAEATSFFRFSRGDKHLLYSDRLWRQLGQVNAAEAIISAYNNADAEDELDRMLYADFMTRLPEHSLMLTDKMTMAHGLEARSPFLDHRLVEYLAQVPAAIKIGSGRPKFLMRKMAGNYLPDSIVKRDKQGFMFPIAYWFRHDLYAFIENALLNSHFVREGLFERSAVERMLEEHRGRRADHHVRLWMMLNLEIWHQLYVEQIQPDAVIETL
ncbi:MAG: asparagine synthase (glutamine-hydrolyzing) [Anaerolineales bacterium]|nr:asparagine synthase (glutamine-hydrolyzing) [Anaerolineales bacterium]